MTLTVGIIVIAGWLMSLSIVVLSIEVHRLRKDAKAVKVKVNPTIGYQAASGIRYQSLDSYIKSIMRGIDREYEVLTSHE